MVYSLWYEDNFLLEFTELKELEVYLIERNIVYNLLHYNKGKALISFVETHYYVLSSNGKNILNVKENEDGK